MASQSQEPRGKKRKLHIWDVSEIEESSAATVNGVVTKISPIKNSKKNTAVRYFNGLISDGNSTARIVSFDASLHNAVEQAFKNRSSVSFVNCQVKPNAIDKELEIVATNRSRVEKTSRTYTVSYEEQVRSKEISIAELSDISATNQHVDITVKVLNVDPSTIVHKNDGSNLKKQDCTVGDSTGTCRLVLWETDVDTLVQGKSYQIKEASVRVYNDKKFLSVGANCTCSEVDDIGVVKQPSGDDNDNPYNAVEGEIDTVLSVEQYYSCKICRSKLERDGAFAACLKCNSLTKVAKCEIVSTARVVIGDDKGNDHIVSIFDTILTKITESIHESTLQAKLLSSPKMIFNIDNRNVVVAVTEPKAKQ